MTTERPVEYRGFSDALLSLRGIAAVTVLIFHGMAVFDTGGQATNMFQFGVRPHFGTLSAIITNLFLGLFNGHAAVTFFFVHSGFVLALSINRMRWSGAGWQGVKTSLAYANKRVFRLWPMVIVSCILGFVFQNYFGSAALDQSFTKWFTDFFSTPTSPRNLWDNVVLRTFNLSPFLWSLSIEAYGSILMPFLFLLSRKNFSSHATMFVFAFLSTWLSQKMILIDGHAFSGLTFVFLSCFYAGCLMTYLYHEAPSLPRWVNRDALSIMCVGLLVGARWFSPNIEGAVLLETVASMAIIYSVYYYAQGPVHRFCELPVVKFFGLISFSLYVNSLLCVQIAGRLMGHFYGGAQLAPITALGLNAATTVLSLALCTGVSALTFKYIEKPFMEMGKKMAKKIETSRAFFGPQTETL